MPTQIVQRSLHLPAQADSPRAARRAVAEVLVRCGRTEWLSDAEIAVTELVTNAVLYARTPVMVTIECGGGELRVEVEDASPAPPVIGCPGPEALRGRGMGMIAAVSSDFGIERTADGKRVWFTIKASPVPACACAPRPVCCCAAP